VMSNAPVDDIATTLRNAYGDRAQVMVDIEGCECLSNSCDSDMVEIDEGNWGKLDDTVWCPDCGWEGVCRDLLTG
jgi:hypothetical protein